MLAKYYFVGKEQVFSKMQSCEFYHELFKGVIPVLHKSYNLVLKTWFKICVQNSDAIFQPVHYYTTPCRHIHRVKQVSQVCQTYLYDQFINCVFYICNNMYSMHSFGSLFTEIFDIEVKLSIFTIMQTLHYIIKSPFRLFNISTHLEKQTWFSLNKYQSNNGTGCCWCSQV